MKIINRVEFLKLPSGTLYREYKPHVFGELRIKGDTWTGRDFGGTVGRSDEHTVLHLDLVDANDSNETFDIMERASQTGDSFKFDYDGWMRDGWSPEDNKKLYAVYEPEDVRSLIELLQMSVTA